MDNRDKLFKTAPRAAKDLRKSSAKKSRDKARKEWWQHNQNSCASGPSRS